MRRSVPILVAAVLLPVASPAWGQAVSVTGTVGNGGTPLSWAAVTLEPLDGAETSASPMVHAEIDQAHLRFVPRVLIVTPGTEVRFLNSDPLMHNVFGPGMRGGDTFDLGSYAIGDSESRVFENEGVHTVLCHIHPEMVAYVVVSTAPYRAVTAADGSFALDSVPPGRYRITIWHARRSRDTTSFEIEVPERGLRGLDVSLEASGPRVRGSS